MKTFKHYYLLGVILVCTFTLNSCSENDPVLPEEPPGTEKEITSFTITASLNGLSKSLRGEITTGTITVSTQIWIENLEKLIPTFQAKGTVTVNGVPQVSGETANDFSKELVYTVTAEDQSVTTYKVILSSPQLSGLPIIKIDTENKSEIKDKENYIPSTVKITDPSHKEYNLEAVAGVRGRGNSTWNHPKKPYRIKFDKKQSLFGYGKAKSWVLLANYQDPTLLMNTIAFELGHRFGLLYTNHANHLELYLNEKYMGSYVLTEQVQVNEARVNIDEETGFLVEMDTYMDEDYQFYTDIIKLPVMIKSPELDNPAGMDFIKKAMKDLEDALFDESKNFPENNYKELIDINSLVSFIMINEIVRNTELQHPKSMYMYKEQNGKMQMGPLWDFDWGFSYSGGGFTYFLQTTPMLCTPGYKGSQTGYKFFCRFFDDPEFRRIYKNKWNELYASQISTIDKFIDQMAEKLHKSQKENFEIWNNNLEYDLQINKMKTWYKGRIEYLNTEINKF